jgi:hypothetical protein
MLKFSDFSKVTIIMESETLSQLGQPTAAAQPVTTAQISLEDSITAFLNKHKKSNVGQSNVDLSKFGNKQLLKIVVEPNFQINCKVIRNNDVNKQLKTPYCIYSNTNIDDIKEHIEEWKKTLPKSTIVDASGNPIEQTHSLYFKVFPNPQNASYTNFYFFDNKESCLANKNHIFVYPGIVKSTSQATVKPRTAPVNANPTPVKPVAKPTNQPPVNKPTNQPPVNKPTNQLQTK